MKRILNGCLVTATGAVMEPLPLGAHGVFETLLLRNGVPEFLPEHWSRFAAGCRWHGFEPPASGERIGQQLLELARENRIENGVARFVAWRGTETGTVSWEIETGAPRPHMSKRAFHVAWGPALPVATADRAFKHLRRAEWLQALQQARAKGEDEVLLRDARGRVVEAAVSNVFLIIDGVIHTPALQLGPLPGVLRAQVVAVARTQGWPVQEGEYTASDVEAASEVWLTNSLIGVRPVAQVATRTLPPAHPVLDEFRNAWRRAYGSDPAAVFPE